MKDFNEKAIINFCSKVFSIQNKFILKGIGDDAAVLKFGNKKLLATTDSLQENIHFNWKYTSSYLLGRKALAVNLSDIAAMGGEPLWALVSVAIPTSPFTPSLHPIKRGYLRRRRGQGEVIQEFFKGLQSSAKEFGVSIVGGDTDHSKKDWKITITLLGEVKNPVYRSGAKVGDDIWVTGFLGCSALGLEILCRGGSRTAPTKDTEKFIQAHLNPQPRIRTGMLLSQKNLAHSMTDISDGLFLDLEHLCEASKVGAEIDWKSIPLSKGFEALCLKLKVNSKDIALSGGEDYELLFTAPVRKRNEIEKHFSRIKTPVARIGRIVSGKKIRIFDENRKEIVLKKKGYSHF